MILICTHRQREAICTVPFQFVAGVSSYIEPKDIPGLGLGLKSCDCLAVFKTEITGLENLVSELLDRL